MHGHLDYNCRCNDCHRNFLLSIYFSYIFVAKQPTSIQQTGKVDTINDSWKVEIEIMSINYNELLDKTRLINIYSELTWLFLLHLMSDFSWHCEFLAGHRCFQLQMKYFHYLQLIILLIISLSNIVWPSLLLVQQLENICLASLCFK